MRSGFHARYLPRRTADVALTALLSLAGGCDNVLTPPPPPRLPLVEGLLVAGSQTSTIRISWPQNTDSGSTKIPIAAELVTLTLEEVGGGAARFSPIIDSPGLYRASLPIVAGTTYRMAGTVGGHSLSASVTVPRELLIVNPAGDPLSLTARPELDYQFAVDTIEWIAPGATALIADSIRFTGGYDLTRDRRTTMIVPRWSSDSTERDAIRFWALDETAESYVYGPRAGSSNVEGGLGALGAATITIRQVRWR